LNDRQFLISKSKKPEINSKNGVKSQSDSYRTDVLAVCKVADCGRFLVKLHKSGSGLQPINNQLSRQFFIPRVGNRNLFIHLF